jgi:hypothetical protein
MQIYKIVIIEVVHLKNRYRKLLVTGFTVCEVDFADCIISCEGVYFFKKI